MKLLSVTESNKPEKKMMAIFEQENGRKKTVHFGQAKALDFTKTHDKEQRERYRTRHAKDLETGDPTRAGFLSYYILWGDSTSMKANIISFKKRFSL
jgi:hypothetical protein